jgi:hypothetical protein
VEGTLGISRGAVSSRGSYDSSKYLSIFDEGRGKGGGVAEGERGRDGAPLDLWDNSEGLVVRSAAVIWPVSGLNLALSFRRSSDSLSATANSGRGDWDNEEITSRDSVGVLL